MNRTQKFALNSLITALSQIVVMIVGFITPRIMISTYGSEINGLVSSLSQFISYLSLVEAGLGGAAIFSLYKPLAINDQNAISRIIIAAKKSYLQAGYIFSSGIFALAVVYGLLCRTEFLSFSTIFSLTLLLGVNGCLDFFMVSGYRVLLTADQKTYVLSGIGISQTVLRTIIICTFAFFRTNIVLLYALALIPIFLKALLVLFYGKKNYPNLDKHAVPDQSSLSKRWDVIYQQILGTVQTGAPVVIATILLNLKMVSVYSVYNMVVSGINGILGIFITGLPAGFGELIAKNEHQTLQKSVSEFEVAYYYILSIVYGITMVMILPFISIYTAGFEDVNYYYPTLAFAIVLNGLLYNIKTPQSMLIISSGMYKETRWRVTIQGAIIIVCGVLLGIPFGLAGILIGSCISNLYRTIDLLFFVSKNITHLNPKNSALRMLRVFMTILIISAPLLFIQINVSGYLSWILYAAGFGIFAVLMTTLMTWVFDHKEFIALLLRLKTTLMRKHTV